MKAKNKLIFPWVMTLFAFISFIAVYLVLTVFVIEPKWFSALIFVIPALVLLMVTLLSRNGVISAKTGNITAGILSPIFFLVCVVLFIFFIFQTAVTDITDPALYKKVLRISGYPQNELIAQFPEEIPEEAENISFLYCPQFLQGAGEYLLACELEKDTARELMEKHESEIIWRGKKAEIDSSPIPPSLISRSVFSEVDQDTEIWILQAQPYITGSFNHGKLRMILLDPSGRTVFYSSVW